MDEISIQQDGIPSIESLAPLVDQFSDIAREEIPAPRTGWVRLYDDNAYRIIFHHSRHDGEEEDIVYDRDTGDVYWRDTAGTKEEFNVEDPESHEVSWTTVFEEGAERVVAKIEPQML